jgi:multidrug efflux pump subunit AcrA (membrane-fusion protein)
VSQPAPRGDSEARRTRFPRGFVLLMAFLTVLVPFLFWRGTWFGMELSDAEIRTRLTEASTEERHLQHALSRVAERIEKDRAAAQAFYPLVVARGTHPSGIIRTTVAWVCGMDPAHGPFRAALQSLLPDPDPRVARQAALGLAAHGDAAGRDTLLGMLRPFPVHALTAGVVEDVLAVHEQVQVGNQIARIRAADGQLQEQRAPLNGRIESVQVERGRTVAAGAPLCTLEADPDAVFQSLRALYLVGRPEDAEAVKPWVQPREGFEEAVVAQARRTLARLSNR